MYSNHFGDLKVFINEREIEYNVIKVNKKFYENIIGTIEKSMITFDTNNIKKGDIINIFFNSNIRMDYNSGEYMLLIEGENEKYKYGISCYDYEIMKDESKDFYRCEMNEKRNGIEILVDNPKSLNDFFALVGECKNIKENEDLLFFELDPTMIKKEKIQN